MVDISDLGMGKSAVDSESNKSYEDEQVKSVEVEEIKYQHYEDEIWDLAISITEKKKDAPILKIGVIGNADVGKTSISRRFTERIEIDPDQK